MLTFRSEVHSVVTELLSLLSNYDCSASQNSRNYSQSYTSTRVALAIISRLGVNGLGGLISLSCLDYSGLLGGLNSLNSLSGLNSYVRNVGGSTSNNYSCNSVSRDICEASVRSQRYGNLGISSSVNSVGEGQENSAVSGNCSASPSELVGLSAEDTTGNSLVSGKGQTSEALTVKVVASCVMPLATT